MHDGRLERLGYIFLGSWFLEQLRHEAGVYIDWEVLRDLPPIARKLYGLLENDRFEEGDAGEEWQAYWLGDPFFASVGSTCARERDNVAAVARACEAISAHPGTGYRFTRERVAVEGGWAQQLVVARPAGKRRPPRAARPVARDLRLGARGPGRAHAPTSSTIRACMHARVRAAMEEDMQRERANMTA